MSQFSWDWFVTLTFRGQVGEWGAERKWRGLIKQIRYDAGHRVEWVRVTEWHKFRNVPHYHALLLNCQDLRRMRYVDWWWNHGFGIARVLKYNEKLGVGYYLGKYLLKASSDIAISRGLKHYLPVIADSSHGMPLMPPPAKNTS